jgi:hypothetical protein
VANPNGLIYSSPVYFDGKIYLQGVGDVLKAFALKLDPATNTMMLDETPVSQGTIVSGFPGTVESISADGTSNGIVWSPQVDAFGSSGPAVLRAYDANNLTTPLYSSDQAGPRDTAGGGVKFTTPTIANGTVYLGTQFEVDVYGLLRRSPAPAEAQQGNVLPTNLVSDLPGAAQLQDPHLVNPRGISKSGNPFWVSDSGASPSTVAQGTQALNMDFGALVLAQKQFAQDSRHDPGMAAMPAPGTGHDAPTQTLDRLFAAGWHPRVGHTNGAGVTMPALDQLFATGGSSDL